ncbi:MAG: GAF domain-containing protein [Anaerolineae bacterium]|nr:GAF domain-containing protein [Anaerolineae bacterium]
MNESPGSYQHPFRSIRARTGLIFFAGLALLVALTLVITLLISASIRQDGVRMALIAEARGRLGAWRAAGTGGRLPPPAEVEMTLRLLMDGGAAPPEAGDLHLRRPSDEAERLALERALSAWQGLVAADPQRAVVVAAAAEAALAEAERAVQVRHDQNVGMVRGMYAALFVASLIFLLIGLWFIQQAIVAPLEALHQAVRRIAAGDLDTPTTLGGASEFEELAQSFEGMRLELRESRRRLERWTSDLEAAVAQRTDQLAALSQVIAAACRSLDLDTVLRTALEQALQAMRLEMGGIWLLDDSAQQLQLAVEVGMAPALRAEVQTFALNEGITGRAAASGQTLALEDVTLASDLARVVASEWGIQGIVAVPIRLRERILGVLDVMTQQPRAFTSDELVLLTSIGQQIGIAVDSLRLMHEVREQAQNLAALRERERIGIELHDGLLQTLGYLFLRTDQLEAMAHDAGLDDLARQLAAQRDVLEHASQEARRFIHELSELPPAPVPLHAALAEMIAAFQQEHTLDVALRVVGPPAVLQVDTIAQLVRIARESLINAAKHGRASHAVVSCSVDDGVGHLSVCDDGCGFDVTRPFSDDRPHFGLSVMQARAARIGGVLRIETAPGRGTCVHVSWKLPGAR